MAGLMDFEPELNGNGHGMAFSPDLDSKNTPYTNGNASPGPAPAAAPSPATARAKTYESSGPAVPEGADALKLPHVLGLATTNPERVLLQKDFPDLFVNVVETSDPRVPDLTKKISEYHGLKLRP